MDNDGDVIIEFLEVYCGPWTIGRVLYFRLVLGTNAVTSVVLMPIRATTTLEILMLDVFI
jgi:hypothetical protein